MASIPGVTTTLNDGYFALANAPKSAQERLVILARTLSNATTGHHFNPIKYTSLADVATAHTSSSECYEAFYHALFSGASDIWICPLPSSGDRGLQLSSGYANLEAIEPTIIVPYGRSSSVSIDASGNETRTVPTGDALGAVATSGTYLATLASACYTLSTNARQCIGIMGVEPPASITASGINDWIMGTSTNPDAPSGTLVTATGTVNKFPSNITDAFARYVSVVMEECETAGMRGWDWRYGGTTAFYRSNGALNYAGLLCQLLPHEPPTNKVVKSVSYKPFRYSITQLKAISSYFRAVSFKQRPDDNIIKVCDSPTYASSASDFRRLSTIRIVGAAISAVNTAASKFVGTNMSLWNQNALKTAIVTALDELKKGQAINRYSYSIEFVPTENAANITLILEPAWELRIIRTTVSVTF
jgi:hypothetical protein